MHLSTQPFSCQLCDFKTQQRQLYCYDTYTLLTHKYRIVQWQQIGSVAVVLETWVA